MICFASFVPHSPLLIPEVAGENIAKLKNTVDSYRLLEQELYSSKPDCLVIISPHQSTAEPVFTINQAPKIKVAFRKFGDLITDLVYDVDFGLAYKIKESLETKMPLVLLAEENVHYGIGVPLFYLSQNLENIKVININSANLPGELLIEFGREIKEHLSATQQRVAVIASGDLSHTLTKDSPKGYSPNGQKFDTELIKIFSSPDAAQKLARLDETMVTESQQCALNSALILMGILEEINYTPHKLSYEAPFGIGYLVHDFKIN